NPFNQRNPRLMNYLRAYKPHSTTIEDSLQISPIMQNKPNFQIAQMNVKSVITKDYENQPLRSLPENKPNTNPIQTQTNPIYEKPKMNVSSIVTKDYENIYPCGVPKNKPNSNAISQKAQMNATFFTTKDYENQPLRGINPMSKQPTRFKNTPTIGIFCDTILTECKQDIECGPDIFEK
ncbi:MAG: hypothetical protein KAY65_09495, partial [Planctomycetes bacterium]|nr:hypothetical protein [Planctomycetota bacterium]